MEFELRTLIDWLQFTIKTVPANVIINGEETTLQRSPELEDIYRLLDIPETEWREMPTGLYGYRKQMICGDIRILYEGRGDMGMHVQLSGQGCREFESFYDGDWFGLMARIAEARGVITRIDLACDEIRYDGEKPYFTVRQIVKKTKTGECRSKFRTAHRIEKIKIVDGSSDGNTIYFGSAQSDIQVRLYEKNFERVNAGKELEERLTTWNRFEIQLYDARAQMAMMKLLEGIPCGNLIMGILGNYLNFVDKQEDSNKARWPICEWWTDYLQNVEKLRLALTAPDKTIDQKREWIDRQVNPTLAEVWYALGGPDMEYFVEMINDGLERMTEAQWLRAMEYRERMAHEAAETKERREKRYTEQLNERMKQVERYRLEVAAAAEKRKEPFADGSN